MIRKIMRLYRRKKALFVLQRLNILKENPDSSTTFPFQFARIWSQYALWAICAVPNHELLILSFSRRLPKLVDSVGLLEVIRKLIGTDDYSYLKHKLNASLNITVNNSLSEYLTDHDDYTLPIRAVIGRIGGLLYALAGTLDTLPTYEYHRLCRELYSELISFMEVLLTAQLER